MIQKIQLPISSKMIETLTAGDEVLLSGTLYTARDAAHKKMMDLLDNGEALPFDIAAQCIYYVGPCPAPAGKVIGSAGPTTSGRMDAYTPRLLALGLKGMIGKGERDAGVVEAMIKHRAVYFGAVGGAAARIAASIVSEEVIAFPELGTEAIRKLEVKDFPAFVVIDANGRNAYEEGRSAAANLLTRYDQWQHAFLEESFQPRRITIFAGHYGSGKSEISVQYARALAASGKKVLMADMDIVNPFFRSLDAKALLEKDHIQVVAPLYANTNVDVPAMVPEVASALQNQDLHVVLDVGGDGDGARVLGRYHRDIQKDELTMVFVMNTSRPLTRNAKLAAEQMDEIAAASRQQFTHVLNNTHMLDDTTWALVAAGAEETKILATMKNVVYAGTVLSQDVLIPVGEEIKAAAPLLSLERQLGVDFDA